ncbi:hypothetical protein l11_13830 [Neisseria weaveri LMG 5135]|nr:hypothetical protein l11_13830 [Neisseria weaveri LMG 5135]
MKGISGGLLGNSLKKQHNSVTIRNTILSISNGGFFIGFISREAV